MLLYNGVILKSETELVSFLSFAMTLLYQDPQVLKLSTREPYIAAATIVTYHKGVLQTTAQPR